MPLKEADGSSELSITTEENLILEKIFLANYVNLNEPKAKKFRVENYELISVIDELISEQLIKEKHFVYRLTISGFAALRTAEQIFVSVKSQCEAIFGVAKQHYLNYFGEESLTINSLAEQINTDRSELLTAVYFVSEAADVTCGRSNDLSKEDACIVPYEKVLDHENFESALDIHRNWLKLRREKSNVNEQFIENDRRAAQGIGLWNDSFNGEHVVGYTKLGEKTFVHQSIISELEEVNAVLPNFDLKKLIQICKEMNNSYSTNSYYALASLQRMLIDHIPPFFDCKNFTEVANNYGTRSWKKHMQYLDKSLRSISDSYLHQHIRSSEVLPNENTANFSSDIDVLLSEIIRKANI